MSSTIKGKALDAHLKRQVKQDTAQQKSQATSNHLTQLKRMTESVHKSKTELRALANSQATVNHIVRGTTTDEQGDEDQTPSDHNRLYTRQGRLDSSEDLAIESTEPEKVAPEEIAVDEEQNATEVFRSRDEDNFYKVQDRGNEISEDAFGYYIDAYAPENEKDGIRVSITNDKAIISGSRKAQNELQEHDKKISTNNFQIFREEFAFGEPVISDGMTRERDGDYIRFFIPKLVAKNDTNT